MKRAIIQIDKCKYCFECLAANGCPNGAIWVEAGELPVVASGCCGCRKCVGLCPYDAPKMI